jgi:hypothetical protein
MQLANPSGWAKQWEGFVGDEPEPPVKPQRVLLNKWRERQETLPRSRAEARAQPFEKKVLPLHKGLDKAESAILTQLHIGKIGFKGFLYDVKVPEITAFVDGTSLCSVRSEGQVVRVAKQNEQIDFNWLLSTVKGVKKLTR